MHRLLQHKNILSALACFTHRTEIWMVMPLMSYGLYFCPSLFITVVIGQGGHKPGKPEILRNFSEHGKLREFSGNSVQSQGKL